MRAAASWLLGGRFKNRQPVAIAWPACNRATLDEALLSSEWQIISRLAPEVACG